MIPCCSNPLYPKFFNINIQLYEYFSDLVEIDEDLAPLFRAHHDTLCLYAVLRKHEVDDCAARGEHPCSSAEQSS